MRPLALLVLLFVVIASVPTVLQVVRGRIQIFRPDQLTSIAFLLYTLPVALDILVMGNSWGISEDTAASGLWLCILALGGIQFGYYSAPSFGLLFFRGTPAIDRSLPRLRRWIPAAIGLIGVSLFVFFVIRSFGSFSNYIFESTRQDRFRAAVGHGHLTIGLYIAHTAWAILFSDSLAEVTRSGSSAGFRRIIALNVIAFVAYSIVFFLTGDRRQPFFLGMTLLCVYQYYRPLRVLLLTPAAFGTLLVLQVFSKIRFLASQPLEMLRYARENFSIDWLNVATGELGSHFFVLSTVLESVDRVWFGSTYIAALLSLIPQAIYPDRPLPPTSWFTMTFFPEVYAVGGGFGFSFVAEAYMNFSLCGPLIVGVACGILLRNLYSVLVESGRWHMGRAMYAAMTPLLFLLVRSDTVTTLKVFLGAVVTPVALSWFLNDQVFRRRERVPRNAWQ